MIFAIAAATFDLLTFGTATGMLFVVIGLCAALVRAVRRDVAVTTESTHEAHAVVGRGDPE